MRFLLLLLVFCSPLWPPLCHGSDNCIYGADLFGDQMIPPTGSNAYGHLEAWFLDPPMGNHCHTDESEPPPEDWTIHIRLRFIRSLEGIATGVFLGRGSSDEEGELLQELLLGTDYPAEVEILFDSGDCPDLIEHDLFIIVTTDAYPLGEVRGQIEESCGDPVDECSWGTIRTMYH